MTKCCSEVCMNLRLGACWVHKVLARHLNRLISPGKLSGVDEALLTCWTVGVWHSYQIGSLGTSTDQIRSVSSHYKYSPNTHLSSTCFLVGASQWLQTRKILKIYLITVMIRTCAAASVRPHSALEPELTESPNSGRLEFLALWEMPAMDSPRTWQQQTRIRKCFYCVF